VKHGGFVAKQKVSSGPYQHHVAPFARVNGGAEEFVFEMGFGLPLYSFRGDARLAGQFLPFGSGPTMVSLYPTGAPQGIPFVNGDFYTQASEDQGSDGLPGE
jgi:hypothetical protein